MKSHKAIFLGLILPVFFGCGKSNPAPQNPTPTTPPVTETQTPVADVKAMLDDVQKRTINYFWLFNEPNSGMARERTASNELVTSGGTGFGIMAIISGVERGWISRTEAAARIVKITSFLEKANRFHGAWPHWMNGNNGAVIPFSAQDNGGDLVETSYLVAGLLTAKAYFTQQNADEVFIRQKAQALYDGVEWDWYASSGSGKLLWHWSPNYGFAINLPITGYNECLITYIMAMGSATHPLASNFYQNTWLAGTYRNGQMFNGYTLPLGPNSGGPLFFAHYSYLGLDPRQMQDTYANYAQQNLRHTLINRAYCLTQTNRGYSTALWGLTASDNPSGYGAQSPTNDNGTISPTAALSSIAYTPAYSLDVMTTLYTKYKSQMLGDYGFLDALNPSQGWYAKQYLAIDQGPIAVMTENYRSGLFWNLFMALPEVQKGLQQAAISKPSYPAGFPFVLADVRTNRADLVKHPDKSAFVLDVSTGAGGTFTLVLEKEDGTAVQTIWNNESKTAGVQQVSFGANISTAGIYRIRLSGQNVNEILPLQLR